MSCFIYAVAHDFPDDYLDHYALSIEKKYQNVNEVIECSINDIECDKYCKKIGNGFFVKIFNKIYVVTCFHIIGMNNMETYAIFFEKKTNKKISVKLTVKKIIEEFDIAILNIDESLNFAEAINIYEFDELDIKINKINKTKKFIIKSYTYIAHNKEIQPNDIETDYHSIENIKYITNYTNGYEIPSINLSVPDKNAYEMQGTSGSIVINDNVPIGVIMRSDVNQNIINAMPINIVINIVKSFLEDDSKELKLLILNTDFVADKDDNIVNFYGHYVTENFGITYMTNLDKKFSFKIEDIIIRINNNEFLEDGQIWCEKLGCKLRFKTYAMLNFIFNDYIDICYMRNNKLNYCKISGVSHQLYFSYNLQSQRTFLYYDGFVFVELSEEILKYFGDRDIFIENAKLNFINGKIKQKKYVILISINYEHLIDTQPQNKEHWLYLQNSGFPYTDNKLTILKKVGNDEVTNLQTLKHILLKKKMSKTMTYSYY